MNGSKNTPPPKKFGYARVSTEDQSLEMQRKALEAAGCEKVFEEKKSGVTFQRKQLDLVYKYLRPGDTLAVWALDRLGRDSVELQRFVQKLLTQGIHFEVLQSRIDTSTAQGKFAFQVMCAMAELERNVTSERTKAGMAVARANGKEFGRPTDIVGQKREDMFKDMQDVSMSVAKVAEKWGYSMNTLNKHFPRVRRQALISAGKLKA